MNNLWVGRPVTELVAAWGTPDSTLSLEDGRKVMMWTSFQSPGQVVPCRQSFTVSAAGTVEKFSSSACSAEPIISVDRVRFNEWPYSN